MLSVDGHFYANFFVQLGQNKKIYLLYRQRVWLWFHKLLKPHATTLHTNYKQEPHQRLRWSTLQFGFGFFKAPFLLASRGVLFLESLLKYKTENDFWMGAYDYKLTENISSHVVAILQTEIRYHRHFSSAQTTKTARLGLNWPGFLKMRWERLNQKLWIRSQLQPNSDWSHINERKHFSWCPQQKPLITVTHITPTIKPL